MTHFHTVNCGSVHFGQDRIYFLHGAIQGFARSASLSAERRRAKMPLNYFARLSAYMRKEKEMDKLQNARNEINEIDRQIAELFVRRMSAVKDVAEYKLEHGLQILDESREQSLIKQNAEYIKDAGIRSYYIQFLQDMLNVSKQYQRRLMEGLKVAYSGVEGAFSYIAAKRIFPDARLISYDDFQTAYDSVSSGECDCAVMPIENSFAGEVGQVMDLMFSGSLHVNGVYSLRISQNLLGIKGAALSDIQRVVSHPQALDQCAGYIKKHGFESIQSANTARAAKSVAETGDIHLAAIASMETAELYGLEVIDHDINESLLNTTRFAVFSRVENANHDFREDSRFLLMFTVKNVAGALAKAINVIGEYGFNMSVLRSRPMKELAWKYYFYVEADGDETSENGRKMLEKLSEQCDMLKVLGSYSIKTELKGDGGQ